MGRIKRVKHVLPSHTVKQLYDPLIQSQLDYSLTVWINCVDCHLNIVQQITIINSNISNQLPQLGWMSLPNRFKYLNCSIVYKLISGNILNDLLPIAFNLESDKNLYNTRYAYNETFLLPRTIIGK